ncbi:MAG: DUF1616 domain-containing protein [Nanoarchaeota archaeon]
MKPLIKGHNSSLVNHTFQTILITYLVLLLVEQIFSGFVTQYLNLNYLLVIVIIVGILDVFSEHPVYSKRNPTSWDYFFVFALGILGFVILKYKTSDLGWLSWVISGVAGILIILLSFLVLEDEEETYEREESKFNFKPLPTFIISLIALLVISILISVFSSLGIVEALRIVFGSVYVLFIPGFIISFIFFRKEKIDSIERVALSFALSIAVVPLTIFYLNLIGVKINLLNSFFTILGIILISLGIIYYQESRNSY